MRMLKQTFEALQEEDAEGSMLRALRCVFAAQSVTPQVVSSIMDKVSVSPSWYSAACICVSPRNLLLIMSDVKPGSRPKASQGISVSLRVQMLRRWTATRTVQWI